MQRQQQQQTKPFCKVCRDAGKTEAVYTSHYVKSRDGIVTCPTLKNLTCRYCKKNGHTVSHCQALLKIQNQPQPLPKPIQKPQPKKEELFPLLPSSSKSVNENVVKTGYADMLKKEPVAPPKKRPLPMPIMAAPEEYEEYEEEYQDDDYDRYNEEYEDQEEDYDW
jgi:hypothetical protein